MIRNLNTGLQFVNENKNDGKIKNENIYTPQNEQFFKILHNAESINENIWFTEINTPLGQFFQCPLLKLQKYLETIYGLDYNNLTKIQKIEPAKLNGNEIVNNKQFFRRIY